MKIKQNFHAGGESEMKWQTPIQLRQLLCEIVSWESETFSLGESQFPHLLKERVCELSYFQQNPTQIQTVQVDEKRSFVSAFYKKEQQTKTVVLISHFDTVPTEEYGYLKPLATQPEALTTAFREQPHLLSIVAQKDLMSGDYLFGRGVMDMKMGLVLHIHLLEKAMHNDWNLNLLLITVPDEEVNSAGMRAAVEHIAKLKEEYQLDIQLFLNSEPSFSQDPSDIEEYIYTGTIGKIMPSALFYGKETHVGEPLKGITASFLNSYLTAEMEWNDLFLEQVYDEVTPLPVSLEQKDLKTHYSTQTPYRSYALYNIFLMQRSAEEIFSIFKKVAEQAMAKCQERYLEICQRQGVTPIGDIKVLTYQELYEYSVAKLSLQSVEEIIDEIMKNAALDDREKSIAIADQLMIRNQELAPATVLLFAPPYYPPASSKDNEMVQKLVDSVLLQAKEMEIPLSSKNYFNGISDLSYCQNLAIGGWQAYEENTPVWNRSYEVPFAAMNEISAPVINIGPFGKDAHQISERLHVKSGFEEMPVLLSSVIEQLIGKTKNPE